MRKTICNYWALLLIVIVMPILLWAIIPILPTHDDWMSLTTPSFEPFFTKRNFFFFGYHWRPFDCWIGYIAGRNPALLYPAFNHILVVIGHALCCAAVFRMLLELKFSLRTCNIATLFFFVNPATMATVLAVDSQNQTYSLLWGMVAFIAYLRQKYAIWAIVVFIAALCKENGLMWALISPLLSFGFGRTDAKTLRRDLLLGIGIMAVYALAIIVLPREITIHDDYVPEALTVPKNMVKFFFSSFFTIDYIYLLHNPSRNIILAMLTWIPSLPLFYLVVARKARDFATRRYLCIFISMAIAAAPHIMTAYSMMHTYGVLVFVALMVAVAAEDERLNSGSQPSFFNFRLSVFLFLLTSLFINVHLWHESLRSGNVGKKMAVEAIRKTGKPVRSVSVVIVKDDYPKLSSFCVIPNEAFGWGQAARYETDYEWPEEISDTTVENTSEALKCAKELLMLHQSECVWIVNHDNVEAIRQ